MNPFHARTHANLACNLIHTLHNITYDLCIGTHTHTYQHIPSLLVAADDSRLISCGVVDNLCARIGKKTGTGRLLVVERRRAQSPNTVALTCNSTDARWPRAPENQSTHSSIDRCAEFYLVLCTQTRFIYVKHVCAVLWNNKSIDSHIPTKQPERYMDSCPPAVPKMRHAASLIHNNRELLFATSSPPHVSGESLQTAFFRWSCRRLYAGSERVGRNFRIAHSIICYTSHVHDRGGCTSQEPPCCMHLALIFHLFAVAESRCGTKRPPAKT